MSTYYRSETFVFNIKEGQPDFRCYEDLNDAHAPEKLSINKDIWAESSTEEREIIKRNLLKSTIQFSRNGWAGITTEALLELSGQPHLKFLCGENTSLDSWKFPDGEDGEAPWGYLCGFLLKSDDLKRTIAAIDQLFIWSLNNLDVISKSTMLGGYDREEVSEAITNPITSENPAGDENVTRGEDGDGPWFLYSWLHSVRQVCHTALLCDQAVLHTMDIPQ